MGVILTPGKRTLMSALRVMGLSRDGTFGRYHQVLNRASWSSLKLSQVLLNLLLRYLASADGPLVFGIDETLERRRGQRISAKGIYRDAVRSSKSHFVKASGLRWISLMCLAYIPWAQPVWALPVLTALAALLSVPGPGPSEAYGPGMPDDY
ncbi:MAG TPA: transposase, partial [Dehalococcoidia bacterium]|nr:transposase [Dehalococcoidia bacterium]